MAGEGLTLQRVGSEGDALAHLQLAHVQLGDVHIKGHAAHVVDDRHVPAAGGGVDVVPRLVVLFNDCSGDGGGDGVIVQHVLGDTQGLLRVGEGQLGGADAHRGVVDLALQVGQLKGAQPLVFRHPVPLADGEGFHLPRGHGDHLLGLLIRKGTCLGAGGVADLGGAGGGGVQGAGVVDPDGHAAHHRPSGDDAVHIAHLRDCAQKGSGGAGDGDGGGLAHREGLGHRPVEGDGQFHHIPVDDLRDGGAGAHRVPLLDVELGDGAGGVGLDGHVVGVVPLGLEEIIIGELGLLQIEPRPLHAALRRADVVLRVGGVQGEQHLVLLHQVPLLKGGGHDLPPQQGGGPVVVVGFDGARAGDGDRQVLRLSRLGQIHPRQRGYRAVSTGPQDKQKHHHDGNDDDDGLDPLALFLRRLKGGGGRGLTLRRGHSGFLLHDGHGRTSFWRTDQIIPQNRESIMNTDLRNIKKREKNLA